MQDMKEVKAAQKVNVSYRSGKGNVNIVTVEVSKLHPQMIQKERIEKGKKDKELSELNALKSKIRHGMNFKMMNKFLQARECYFLNGRLIGCKKKQLMIRTYFGWNRRHSLILTMMLSVSQIS